jgi:hypothetical protein
MWHVMGRSDAYRVLVGKPEGRRLLGRLGHRWDSNMKVYLKGVGWEDMDWIDLAQDKGKWQAV